MKSAIAVLAALLIAVPAFAGNGLTPDFISAGAGLDKISGPGFKYNVVPIQVQYAYGFDLSSRSSVYTAHRILAAPGNESEPTTYVNELTALYGYDAGRGFLLFVGLLGSLWGSGITGSPEELYGGTVGFSFPLDGSTTMVVGYRHATDTWPGGDEQGLNQWGLVFGPVFSIGS